MTRSLRLPLFLYYFNSFILSVSKLDRYVFELLKTILFSKQYCTQGMNFMYTCWLKLLNMIYTWTILTNHLVFYNTHSCFCWCVVVDFLLFFADYFSYAHSVSNSFLFRFSFFDECCGLIMHLLWFCPIFQELLYAFECFYFFIEFFELQWYFWSWFSFAWWQHFSGDFPLLFSLYFLFFIPSLTFPPSLSFNFLVWSRSCTCFYWSLNELNPPPRSPPPHQPLSCTGGCGGLESMGSRNSPWFTEALYHTGLYIERV